MKRPDFVKKDMILSALRRRGDVVSRFTEKNDQNMKEYFDFTELLY